MSAIVFVGGLFICLLSVLFQDVQYRKIHIVFPPLIYVFLFLSINVDSIKLVEISLYNSLFFVLVLLVLVIYMSIKNKQFLNPFQNYFGLGDLLFYLAITPAFMLRNYIVFFILSMMFAIFMHLVLKKIMKDQSVPLAGFSALFLMLMILKDEWLTIQKITLL